MNQSKKQIAVLAGDGIGPEVMEQAVRVLKHLLPAEDYHFVEGLVGGAAYDVHQSHFPQSSKELCQQSDAILFGSVGGPLKDSHLEKWKNCETNSILALRKTFGFNTNIRPIKVFPSLSHISPLKDTLLAEGIDFVIFRELLGDIYFGEHRQEKRNDRRFASDVAEYSEDQISTIAHQAFRMAASRRKVLHSVDKANVLATSQLWRTIVNEIASSYPEVTLEHMLVDNCAMQIIRNPRQFDVILTSNMFGDILSDAAAVIPGSLGLTPSASLATNGTGLYEPSGGSAPDIAGKNIANPIAQLLSAALMLRISFKLETLADKLEQAIQETLARGFRTRDLCLVGGKATGCKEFADQIIISL